MSKDVPYIAKVLSSLVFSGNIDPDLLSYRFIEFNSFLSIDKLPSLGTMHLREVAENALFTLAILGRYPKFMLLSSNPALKLGAVYRELEETYPDPELRGCFSSISVNIYPWVEVLPNMRKIVSL